MVAVEIKEAEKLVEIEVEWPETVKVSCPECARGCGIYDHQGKRWWRDLDTMGHTTRLSCRVPRSECPEHGVKTVMVPWAGVGSRFTLEVEARSVELLLIAQSQSAAAEYLELGWHQVHRIQAAAVERGLRLRSTEQVKRVGLDEKSFGRGHHYGTVLTDLDHRRVLEVVEHRKQSSAEKALCSLTAEQRGQLEVVACVYECSENTGTKRGFGARPLSCNEAPQRSGGQGPQTRACRTLVHPLVTPPYSPTRDCKARMDSRRSLLTRPGPDRCGRISAKATCAEVRAAKLAAERTLLRCDNSDSTVPNLARCD